MNKKEITKTATDLAIKNGLEVCLCAANFWNGQIWRGNRHNHSMEAMHDELSYYMSRQQMHLQKTDKVSGFLTNFNRFVDREEGRKLQDAASIPSADKNGYREGTLFSEDLY